MIGRALVLVLVVAACSKDRSDQAAAPPPITPVPPIAPEAMVFNADGCAKAKPHGTFAWIADDYDAALACAKSKQLPLVLDLWAPWCHTCLSMQSTVFADKSLEPEAGKFVFVALDTDRDVNAKAVAKFPPAAWPTFYVVSPDDRQVVLARFVGAASVAQFRAFLDTGTRVLAGGAAGADARLVAAERSLQTKDHANAERELVAALADAPAAWPRRSDALVSLISARLKLKDTAGCMTLAEQTLDATTDPLGNAASASDFLSTAVDCAKARAKDEPDRVKKLRERAVAKWQKLLADTAAPMSIDDRSDAMMYTRLTLVDLGQAEPATAMAEKQRAMLDAAAVTAASPMAAMTFNWPRAEVYVFLGKPLELVPALAKSAKDLPGEYDPRARLGWIYLKGGKLDDAVKWTDDALALAYGPRKTRVLAQRAEIAKQQHDKPGEKRYLEAIVKHLESLPTTQVQPDAITKAKQAVLDLDKPVAAK